MTHAVVELEWIGVLLMVIGSYAAAAVILVAARHLPGRVKRCLTWLAAAVFLGASTGATTAVLYLAHVPIDHVVWNLHPLLFVASAAAFVKAANHLSNVSEHVHELSMGTEEYS